LTAPAAPEVLGPALETLYKELNRREYVEPDPLQFVYGYDSPADREVVAMVSACMAFGSVYQIIASVEEVLRRIGAPARFVREAAAPDILALFGDFRYRFVGSAELAGLFSGMRRALQQFGSLGACFRAGFEPDDPDVSGALVRYMTVLRQGSNNYLLPAPERGSACKRLHLFLRWMIRCDGVDPGGWSGVPAAKLLTPMDTHMHRIALALGLTKRRQADLRAAQETTAAFRRFAPEDPVRYDFALTRLGIRRELSPTEFFRACRVSH
jgi:uncharacterized protein (TIGR02757 family)